MAATAPIVLLGKVGDADSRADLYEACFAELRRGTDPVYAGGDVAAAFARARRDLRGFATASRPLHHFALRFLSFVTSTEEMIGNISDQMILSLFKDLLYLLAKADGKACALVSVLVAHEAISNGRQAILARVCISLVPAFIDCIALRFPSAGNVIREIIFAIARLAAVAPDTMHAVRLSWAPVVAPFCFPNTENDDDLRMEAIAAMQAIRPSCNTVSKELYQATAPLLDGDCLAWMRRAASAEECAALVNAWGVCIRLLGAYLFADLPRWNQLAAIWKICFAHGRPDVAAACLHSWTIVIDAAASSPRALRNPRLLKLLTKPFLYVLQKQVQLSVRIKAIDVWLHLLGALKEGLFGDVIFEIVCAPILSRMVLSHDAAIRISACNLLASFFAKDSSTFTPLSATLLGASSQALPDFAAAIERAEYLGSLCDRLRPLFGVLWSRRPCTLEMTDSELEAIRNAWSLFLARISAANRVLIENVFGDLMGPKLVFHPAYFQSIACVFGVVPAEIWLGSERPSLLDGFAGRLCSRYLGAFQAGDTDPADDVRFCHEWSNFVTMLASALRQQNLNREMVDLAGELIAAALRHDALGSRRGLFAHLLLGRAACIASIALSADHRPSRDPFRRFHSLCMRLLQKACDAKTAPDAAIPRQISYFAVALFRSVQSSESSPAELELLHDYDATLSALIHSVPSLRSLTAKFVCHTFGFSQDTLSTSACPANLLRRLLQGAADPLPPSDAVDQNAFAAWSELCDRFEAETDKLLCTASRVEIRTRLLAKIHEQRLYFDGLLSIAPDLVAPRPPR